MLEIETKGTWYEMGQQVGKMFEKDLRRCLKRFLPFLPKNEAKIKNACSAIRTMAENIYPSLLEETTGMADGAGLDEVLLFRYRFYCDLVRMARNTCSAFFALDDDGNPWVGRTCDIEPEDHWCQICQVRRPKGETATITVTYLGMITSMGMNTHGFCLAGVSAQGKHPGRQGIPVTLLLFKALNKAINLNTARRIITSQPTTGSGVYVAADTTGASCLLECGLESHIAVTPRAEGKTWQACTNFYPSGQVLHPKNPNYLYNAYARYGRLRHMLDDGLLKRNINGFQGLLADVSQPGPLSPKGACNLQTAYSTLFDVKRKIMYLTPGNPNTTARKRKML